jgi:hypothetical protein
VEELWLEVRQVSTLDFLFTTICPKMNFKIKMKEDFCVIFSDSILALIKSSTLKGTFIDDNNFIYQPNLNGLCFMDEDKVLIKYSWFLKRTSLNSPKTFSQFENAPKHQKTLFSSCKMFELFWFRYIF